MKQTSRRDFLFKASLLAAAVPMARVRGEPCPQDAKHVRRALLFDKSDLSRIRANLANPKFAGFWQTMESPDFADDTDFLLHHVRFNNHVADMLRVRAIVERTAFAYAMNGDPRQLELARLAAKTLLAYPKWDLFLEGGTQVIGIQRASEATIALAFALDWLGDGLSADERAAIEDGIRRKGAPACYRTLYGMKYPDRVQGWSMDPDDLSVLTRVDMKHWPLILAKTNLRIIPTAALGIAGCLFQGRDPQADTWIEMARSSVKEFSPMYGPDGSFGEGVSYWGYTTLHTALLAEVLLRTQGIDDRHWVNYPGTVRFALAYTMPRTGEPQEAPAKKQGYVGVQGVPADQVPPLYDIVNFGDANVAVDMSVPAWVAHRWRDPVAQYLATDIALVSSHYGIIWYDPSLPSARPGQELFDDRMDNDRVVSRSGWDRSDGVVALRSGGPANHEHADRNSVIFKAHGDRLFNDPFRADYGWNQPGWILRLTQSHTAVLIDGKGHEYNDGHEGTNSSLASAKVTAFRTGSGWMVVSSDATEAYRLVNPAVDLVERTVVFLKPDILILVDRVKLSVPATVQARFQVYNDDKAGSCSAGQTTFGIERPFATLRGRVAASGGFAIATGQIPITPAKGVYPYVEVSAAAAQDHEILTASTASPAGEPHGELALNKEDGVWRIRGRHRGQAVDVAIDTRGSGPPSVTL